MTTAEMIAIVKVLVENDPEATDAVVTVYLNEAKHDILLRLYRAYGSVPFGARVPQMYEFHQCKLGARKFLRRGGQGESSHSENGISRNWGSVDDEDILKDILPYAKVGGANSTVRWV